MPRIVSSIHDPRALDDRPLHLCPRHPEVGSDDRVEPLGKRLNCGFAAFGKSANGEQHQVLLGLEADGPSLGIAFAQEMADAIAEFGQCAVLGGSDIRSHGISIS